MSETERVNNVLLVAPTIRPISDIFNFLLQVFAEGRQQASQNPKFQQATPLSQLGLGSFQDKSTVNVLLPESASNEPWKSRQDVDYVLSLVKDLCDFGMTFGSEVGVTVKFHDLFSESNGAATSSKTYTVNFLARNMNDLGFAFTKIVRGTLMHGLSNVSQWFEVPAAEQSATSAHLIESILLNIPVAQLLDPFSVIAPTLHTLTLPFEQGHLWNCSRMVFLTCEQRIEEDAVLCELITKYAVPRIFSLNAARPRLSFFGMVSTSLEALMNAPDEKFDESQAFILEKLLVPPNGPDNVRQAQIRVEIADELGETFYFRIFPNLLQELVTRVSSNVAMVSVACLGAIKSNVYKLLEDVMGEICWDPLAAKLKNFTLSELKVNTEGWDTIEIIMPEDVQRSVSSLHKLVRASSPVTQKPSSILDVLQTVPGITQHLLWALAIRWPFLIEISYMRNPDAFKRDFSTKLTDFLSRFMGEGGRVGDFEAFRFLLTKAAEDVRLQIPLLMGAAESLNSAIEVYVSGEERPYRIFPRVTDKRELPLLRLDLEFATNEWSLHTQRPNESEDSSSWSFQQPRLMSSSAYINLPAPPSSSTARSSLGGEASTKFARQSHPAASGDEQQQRAGSAEAQHLTEEHEASVNAGLYTRAAGTQAFRPPVEGSGRGAGSSHPFDGSSGKKALSEYDDGDDLDDAESVTSLDGQKPAPRRVARQKYAYTLQQICNKADPPVRMEDARMMVCQGRKIVYVLSFGVIDSVHCFFDRKPTPSYRHPDATGRREVMIESEWNVVVVPNHWRVAVIVNDEVWIAETKYEIVRPDQTKPQLMYGFHKVDDDGKKVEGSEYWQETPGAAFKGAFEKTARGFHENRHNGRLYVGINYEHPQQVLRDYVSSQIEQGKFDHDPELKYRVSDWVLSRAKRALLFYSANMAAGSSSSAGGVSARTGASSSSSAAFPRPPFSNPGAPSYEDQVMRNAPDLPPAVFKTIRHMHASLPWPSHRPSQWTMRRTRTIQGSKRLYTTWLRPSEIWAMFILVDEAMLKPEEAPQVQIRSRITLPYILRILSLDDTCVPEAPSVTKDSELPGSPDYQAVAFAKYRYNSVLRVLRAIQTCLENWLQQGFDLRIRVLRANPDLAWPTGGPVPRMSPKELHKLPVEARAAWFVARSMDEYRLYPVYKSLRDAPNILLRLVTRVPDADQVKSIFRPGSQECAYDESTVEILNAVMNGTPINPVNAVAMMSSSSSSSLPVQRQWQASSSSRSESWSSVGGVGVTSSTIPRQSDLDGAFASTDAYTSQFAGRYSRSDFAEVFVLGVTGDPLPIVVGRALNARGISCQVLLSLSRRDLETVVRDNARMVKSFIVCWSEAFFESKANDLEMILEAAKTTETPVIGLLPAGSGQGLQTRVQQAIGQGLVMEWTEEKELGEDFMKMMQNIIAKCGLKMPLDVTADDIRVAATADRLSSVYVNETGRDLTKTLVKEMRMTHVLLLLAPMGYGKTTLLAAMASLRLGRDMNIGAAHFFDHAHVSLLDCFRSLTIQLSACIGGLAAKVNASIHKRHERGPDVLSLMKIVDVFKALIVEPCKMIDQERGSSCKRVVVILDGVDLLPEEECKRLGECLQCDTPKWLGFLVSGRPQADLREIFQGSKPHFADPKLKSHQMDIAYCLRASGWSEDDIRRLELVQRSEGNMLFVTELTQAYPNPVSRAALKPNFPFIMANAWDRLAKSFLEEAQVLVFGSLELLLDSLELPRECIAEKVWLEVMRRENDEETFDDQVAERLKSILSHVLVIDHMSIRPPHSSFVPWLASWVDPSDVRLTKRKEAHTRMAEACERWLQPGARPSTRVARFVWSHGLYHWTEAERGDMAIQWVTDPYRLFNVLRASAENSRLEQACKDLMRLLKSNSEEGSEKEVDRLIKAVVGVIQPHAEDIELHNTKLASILEKGLRELPPAETSKMIKSFVAWLEDSSKDPARMHGSLRSPNGNNTTLQGSSTSVLDTTSPPTGAKRQRRGKQKETAEPPPQVQPTRSSSRLPKAGRPKRFSEQAMRNTGGEDDYEEEFRPAASNKRARGTRGSSRDMSDLIENDETIGGSHLLSLSSPRMPSSSSSSSAAAPALGSLDMDAVNLLFALQSSKGK